MFGRGKKFRCSTCKQDKNLNEATRCLQSGHAVSKKGVEQNFYKNYDRRVETM